MLLVLLVVLELLNIARLLLLHACKMQACHDGARQRLLCLLDVIGICSWLQAGYGCKGDAALMFTVAIAVQRQLLLLGSHAGCCESSPTESRALPAAISLSLLYHGDGLCSSWDLCKPKLATRSELLPLRDNAHSLDNLDASNLNLKRVCTC
jgi:hypothetical protein